MLVRQAYTPTATDTKSKPFEYPLETKEPQPLSPRSVHPSPDYTPATLDTDEDSEPLEIPKTRVTSSPSIIPPPDLTTLPSSQHQSERGDDTITTLILCTKTKSKESKEEGTDSKSEEVASKDQQQQVILVEDTTEDEPSGLGYRAARRHAIELAEGTMPSTYETRQSSSSTLNQQMVDETPTPRLPVHTTWEDPEDGTEPLGYLFVPSSSGWSTKPLSEAPVIPSPVASLVLTVAIEDDDFLEIRAHLKLYRTPTIFKGNSDGKRVAMWHARYKDQRKIHELRMHHAGDQRELQELREYVTTLERRFGHREERVIHIVSQIMLPGDDNRTPMLDKDLYDSWKSRMELYTQNKENGRMILESVKHGPLIWPTIEENEVTRTKKYVELSATEKIQADCDLKETNIILQGLPSDIYSLVNHHKFAKDLWEKV
nr:hypothetical protein [Tanacetum cinerariifolium]